MAKNEERPWVNDALASKEASLAEMSDADLVAEVERLMRATGVVDCTWGLANVAPELARRLKAATSTAAPEGLADDLIGELDSMIRSLAREAKERRGFAMVAANIARDRYSAGSSAARVALAISLLHGPGAARDFIADLEHHEGY